MVGNCCNVFFGKGEPINRGESPIIKTAGEIPRHNYKHYEMKRMAITFAKVASIIVAFEVGRYIFRNLPTSASALIVISLVILLIISNGSREDNV